ncbi:hypothetical protein [Rhizobium sp.]|uniref:hypothetical protein n=1 Tax=Rhizobium sp. TaxID=391 RepID=UPI0028989B37
MAVDAQTLAEWRRDKDSDPSKERAEARRPDDLTTLKTVLEELHLDRGIDARNQNLDEPALDLVNLRLDCFCGSEKLQAMLKPIDRHLCQ